MTLKHKNLFISFKDYESIKKIQEKYDLDFNYRLGWSNIVAFKISGYGYNESQIKNLIDLLLKEPDVKFAELERMEIIGTR